MMYRLFKIIGVTSWCLGLGAAIYLMGKLSIPYTSLQPNIDFLATKQNIYHIDYWRYAFYAHVFTSVLVLPAGFTQFHSFFFTTTWHRKLGLLYIVVVVFIAAPTGFLMGLHANGGLAAKASFVLLSIVWFLSTVMAIITAKKKLFIAHGEWMLYSYALTLSAITFRFIVLCFDLLDIHVRPQEVYVTTAWLSWVPNLLIAHAMIKAGFCKRLLNHRAKANRFKQG